MSFSLYHFDLVPNLNMRFVLHGDKSWSFILHPDHAVTWLFVIFLKIKISCWHQVIFCCRLAIIIQWLWLVKLTDCSRFIVFYLAGLCLSYIITCSFAGLPVPSHRINNPSKFPQLEKDAVLLKKWVDTFSYLYVLHLPSKSKWCIDQSVSNSASANYQ